MRVLFIGIKISGQYKVLDRTWVVRLYPLTTRFSGFTIGCITTGVIWIGEPESFLDVILYDNLHVFMWVGGLFFALRGNRA